MEQAILSLLGVKPEGKKQEEAEGKKEEEDEEAEHYMVSTISYIQANLQQSIAPSRIFTRTASAKGTDMVLIQEMWYHKDCIRGLNSHDIPFSTGGIDRPRACILARNIGCYQDSLVGAW